MRLTVATLDSLKRELAREKAALACAKEETRRTDAVAEEALRELQTVRDEGAKLHADVATLEGERLATEEELRRRDAHIFAAGRAQTAAKIALGEALAQIEADYAQQLQRVEAGVERRSAQLGALQRRVGAATERAREKQLHEWAAALGS